MRQGGDPRLPLELALVKVTRPHADLSRESLAHRVELLESRPPAGGAAPAPAAAVVRGGRRSRRSRLPRTHRSPRPGPSSGSSSWRTPGSGSVVEVVRDRQPPAASLLAGTKPTKLAGDTLTLEFPPGHDFHRTKLDEPKYKDLLKEALYEVTGRHLAVVLEAGDASSRGAGRRRAAGRGVWIASLKQTFDAERWRKK